ncbi:hypothetical protein F511_23858 [Dorcoceras hygrometricum]|uniref:Uncharacterized protein n=1 Tax=Dorcoceras hygrometricum TaxID=472368 RepID=A0A2Z7B4W9_9LAMI|nr:hypothetical protein F511_23858 [Dorcoceras hygrometricum]
MQPVAKQPAGSNSIQSRAYMNQLLLHIQSLGNPVDMIPRRKKRISRRSKEIQPVARSSRSDGSAGAKQLTIYEELREMDVNC